MANAPVTIDRLKALQVCSVISTKVTFNYPLAVGNYVKNFVKLFFSKILRAHIRINTDFLNDKIGPLRANSVYISKGIRDLLFRWYFNAE